MRRLSSSERDSFEDAWIGRLIDAAKASGATIPPRTSKGRVREPEEEELSDAPPMKRGRVGAPIILDSDDDATEGPSQPSGSSSAAPTQTIAPNTVIPSTTDVNLVANTQATLATMGWQKWLPGAKETHLKTESRLHREGAEETKKRMEKEKEEKQERARELTTARQRRFRERKKAAEEEEEDLTDDENSNVVLMRGADAAGHERQLTVAETSRVGTQNWRAKRNGTKGGAIQKKTASVNWFHPFLFGPIEKEMRRTGWSPSATVRNLKRDSPLLYKGLQKGTISRWRVKGKNEWKVDTLDKIGSGKAITASGRTGILAPYPDITDTVKETLTGLRTAGGIVNVSVARSLLLSEISQQQPQLLNQFKASETYVRNFLASVMDWTPRKGTRTARHIPDDAPILLKRTFFRLRYAILTGRIPPELIVNADQAGNYVLPSSSHTFHDRGAKQVDIVGKDEKRAYTMMIASTPAGDFLPVQSIWSGKTAGSLPNADAEKYQDAIDRGFVFSAARSKKKTSHFSTIATMEDWVRLVLAPWRAKFLASHPEYDDDQLMVSYIDIYAVHIGEEFRVFVFKDFPYIILIYVPGGCTPLLQPADVGLQRVAKHILHQDSLDFLVDTFKAQSARGVAPKDVKFPNSLPVLRNATVRGLVKMYDFFQTNEGRKVVKQAWRKCEVLGTEWNLSAECLTSKASEKALLEFLREDSALATEIANRCGATHLDKVLMGSTAAATPSDNSSQSTEPEDIADFDSHDDSDVPLNAVVQDSLGIAIGQSSYTANYTVSQATRVEGDDGLSAQDAAEDVWAYTDNGDRWDEMGELVVDD
ncbi:hypothetical protein DFH06DRAFT_1472135 [Mycena polygramma]|nr:hypothetical protein DFH06DRAFT_1472135 [Mycena polygramma]